MAFLTSPPDRECESKGAPQKLCPLKDTALRLRKGSQLLRLPAPRKQSRSAATAVASSRHIRRPAPCGVRHIKALLFHPTEGLEIKEPFSPAPQIGRLRERAHHMAFLKLWTTSIQLPQSEKQSETLHNTCTAGIHTNKKKTAKTDATQPACRSTCLRKGRRRLISRLFYCTPPKGLN